MTGIFSKHLSLNGINMDLTGLSIELLYFSDCPSWKETIDDLKDVLNEMGLTVNISLTLVETNADAEKLKFPGSPTVRLNGQDLFPENQSNFALQCRIYQTPDGLKGTPSKEMVREQISRLLD